MAIRYATRMLTVLQRGNADAEVSWDTREPAPLANLVGTSRALNISKRLNSCNAWLCSAVLVYVHSVTNSRNER